MLHFVCFFKEPIITKCCQWSVLGRGEPDVFLALTNLCIPLISKLLIADTVMGAQSLKGQPLACCADRNLEASSLALVSLSSV